MASLAKKYFWLNVHNLSLLIAEGGTYAKIKYDEKILIVGGDEKIKLSRNRNHHIQRFKKTIVVSFSDFWLLIINKNIFFCAQNFD